MKLMGRDIPARELLARLEERLRTRGLDSSEAVDVPESGVAPRVDPLAFNLRALDEHARWSLDVRNYDHVLAAMEAGLVGDVLVLARARPRGALQADTYVDTRGRSHRLVVVSTVDRAAEAYHQPAPGDRVREVLDAAGPVLLDVDLDCFTSPSDADPTTVLPWPRDIIREYLLPPGSEPFWDAVLGRCVALTLAREPHHCGGLLASHRLFQDVAQVLFGELLRTELP